MVSRLLDGVALNNASPAGVLPYHQNCASMAFSRVLGVGVNPALNYFIQRGWINGAAAIQHDEAILRILVGFGVERVATNEPWLALKARLSTLEDGRYFAVNTGVNDFGGQGIGHAFAITKNGGWSIYANNSQMGGVGGQQPYAQRIGAANHISVWGPF